MNKQGVVLLVYDVTSDVIIYTFLVTIRIDNSAYTVFLYNSDLGILGMLGLLSSAVHRADVCCIPVSVVVIM